MWRADILEDCWDWGGFFLIVFNFSGKYGKGLQLKRRMDKRIGGLGTFLFIPFGNMRHCTRYLVLSSIAVGSLHSKVFYSGHFLSPWWRPRTSARLTSSRTFLPVSTQHQFSCSFRQGTSELRCCPTSLPFPRWLGRVAYLTGKDTSRKHELEISVVLGIFPEEAHFSYQ